MQFPVSHSLGKLNSHLEFAGKMIAIAPLCLMMATVVPANGQTSAPSSSPGDWTQFRTDNMQRWNPDETVLGVGNAGNLQLKWSYSSSTASANTFSDPVTANGILYVNSDDHLYAYNASTGASLWTSTTAGSLATPAVANGVVYYFSDDGNAYALNAGTGARLWSHFTNNYSFLPFNTAVADGVVYASGGDNSEGSCGGGTLYALDASSGAQLWSYAGAEGILYTPAVANGTVYFAACGSSTPTGAVLALNAQTGAVLWSYTGGTFSNPAVADGGVYFTGFDGTGAAKLFAVNASTGKTQWTYAIDFASTNAPAVAEGVVYVASVLTSNNSTNGGGVVGSSLNALNATTGQKLWSNQITETEILETPAVANGVVYINGFANSPATTSHMYALNAGTGALLWSYPLPKTYSNSPIVSNGSVFFTDFSPSSTQTTNNLYAFSIGADLFLRVMPSVTTIHTGDLLTYAFPVWNLGPGNADFEVLNTQIPAGTILEYVRISGTSGLGTCTTPPYHGTGPIVCHENSSMALNTTWTVRLTVKVTAPPGSTITESAATLADSLDPNTANNVATATVKVE